MRGLCVASLLLSLAVVAGGASAQDTAGIDTSPSHEVVLARGQASWYGPRFHGRRTSSGERFDMNGLTAAHESLPFGTLVRVRNMINGREVVVRINDRAGRLGHRIIDLSKAAAARLGFVHAGEARVALIQPPAVSSSTQAPSDWIKGTQPAPLQ